MGKFWYHIYKNFRNKCISSFLFEHFNMDGFGKGEKTTYFFTVEYTGNEFIMAKYRIMKIF